MLIKFFIDFSILILKKLLIGCLLCLMGNNILIGIILFFY